VEQPGVAICMVVLHDVDESSPMNKASDMHAPPRTWLCRSCGVDCRTSLAWTYHERYCAAAGKNMSSY
jgi:hypothetical protein